MTLLARPLILHCTENLGDVNGNTDHQSTKKLRIGSFLTWATFWRLVRA